MEVDTLTQNFVWLNPNVHLFWEWINIVASCLMWKERDFSQLNNVSPSPSPFLRGPLHSAIKMHKMCPTYSKRNRHELSKLFVYFKISLFELFFSCKKGLSPFFQNWYHNFDVISMQKGNTWPWYFYFHWYSLKTKVLWFKLFEHFRFSIFKESEHRPATTTKTQLMDFLG